MADQIIKKEILSVLNCGLATIWNEPICKDPIPLSCGHNICKSCLEQTTNKATIKCNICNQTNTRDLKQQEISPQMFDFIMKTNINTLFDIIHDKFKKVFDECKCVVYESDSRIESQIEFIKDDVLVKIESIKMELDTCYDSFVKELDEIEVKWKLENKNLVNEVNIKQFENDLNELEQNIKNHENLSKENLYLYQDKVKNIQKILFEYQMSTPQLKFIESSKKIGTEMVGDLDFGSKLYNDSKIIENILNNKYEQFFIGYCIHDIVLLSNGCFLATNYKMSNLLLYDENFKFIKDIKTINNKTFGIVCVCTDEKKENIFLSDYENHCVFKTDLELNEIAVFGGNGADSESNKLRRPHGICYFNQVVFVCDIENKRIVELDSDLKFKADHQLDFKPWYIRNINNIAIVRTINASASIYFYDLNTFDLLKRYDGHNGFVGVSETKFFEYYPTQNTFYIYDRKCNLVDTIETDGLTLTTHNGNGFIFKYNSKLYINTYRDEYFVFM